MDIKYNSSNHVLLDDQSREAKSIGIVDSRCQVCDLNLLLPLHCSDWPSNGPCHLSLLNSRMLFTQPLGDALGIPY